MDPGWGTRMPKGVILRHLLGGYECPGEVSGRSSMPKGVIPKESPDIRGPEEDSIGSPCVGRNFKDNVERAKKRAPRSPQGGQVGYRMHRR